MERGRKRKRIGEETREEEDKREGSKTVRKGKIKRERKI